jgi:hypothetical protein
MPDDPRTRPDDRPHNREVEDESLKAPPDGGAPRPGTEPDGQTESIDRRKASTDPGSGEQA